MENGDGEGDGEPPDNMEISKTRAVVEALMMAWLTRGSGNTVDNRDIFGKLRPGEHENITDRDISQVLEYLQCRDYIEMLRTRTFGNEYGVTVSGLDFEALHFFR